MRLAAGLAADVEVEVAVVGLVVAEVLLLLLCSRDRMWFWV